MVLDASLYFGASFGRASVRNMTISPALIRYSCVTVPSMDIAGIAFPYAKALANTGLGIRILPIGAMALGAGPWAELLEQFMTPVSEQFFNVVCASPALTLGAPMRGSDLGGQAPSIGAPVSTPQVPIGSRDVVYQPDSALSALYTDGVQNIAIPYWLSEKEDFRALERYQAVIVKDKKSRDVLAKKGISAEVISPDSDSLEHFFSDMKPL